MREVSKIEYEIMLFCQVPSEDANKHHSWMSLASLLGSSPAGHKNLLVCRLSAVWETLVLRLQLYTKLAIALVQHCFVDRKSEMLHFSV